MPLDDVSSFRNSKVHNWTYTKDGIWPWKMGLGTVLNVTKPTEAKSCLHEMSSAHFTN